MIRLPNFKGALFTTGLTYSLGVIIRLTSSLSLTRLLLPEAFGVITIVMSAVFVIEMLADIGVTTFIVRQHNGDDPRYINTAWTMRLMRGVANFLVLMLAAPLIANWLYQLPALTVPLRVFSFTFLLGGLETMSFPLAIRRKRSHVVNYSELAVNFVSTAFAITYSYFSRDYWGMLFATLLSRLLMVLISYQFYKEDRPRLAWHPDVARELFKFTRISAPSSVLTLATSQFDKFVFLRLFNLPLLGLYGVASGLTGSIEGLITKINMTVLFPRCTHNYRTDPATFVQRYYRENVVLFAAILAIPAAVGGSAELIIHILYPTKYNGVAQILQALMIRATILALGNSAEEMLIAAGQTRVMLVGNLLRSIWTVGGSLLGYFMFGFMGFIYGIALSGLLPLVYCWYCQRASSLIVWRLEGYKLLFAVAVAAASFLCSNAVLVLLRHFS